MNVDVGAAALCAVVVVVVHAQVRRVGASDWMPQTDAADLFLVRHVRVAVVLDELVDGRKLDVFEVERRRRPLDVEVLYPARMSANDTTSDCIAITDA